MEKPMKKHSNHKSHFLKAFLLSFVIALFVITSARAAWNVLNSNPGGIEAHFLSSEMDMEMDLLVDQGSPFFDAFTNEEKVNVLLLGLNGGLTDTIMLAILDLKNKHVDLISIPRDTYYQREGYNSKAERKINQLHISSVWRAVYCHQRPLRHH